MNAILNYFNRSLCIILILQMILLPLAMPTPAVAQVLVNDELANGLLGTQNGLLGTISGELVTINATLVSINKTQGETNTKLMEILNAIRPDPAMNKDGAPTSSNILGEFATSLFAAYTKQSPGTVAIREAQSQKTAPSIGGAISTMGSKAINKGKSLNQDNNDKQQSIANPFENTDNINNYNYKIDDATKLPSYNPNADTVIQAEDLIKQGYSEPEQGVSLTDIAKTMEEVNTGMRKVYDTGQSLLTLSKCNGDVINCTTSGYNTAINILRSFDVQFDPATQATIASIGQVLNFANLIGSLFKGTFSAEKFLNFVKGVHDNQLFAAISKGGLLMDNENETALQSIVRSMMGIFGTAGVKSAALNTNFYLGAEALATANSFGVNDKEKSGIFTDHPRSGTTTTTSRQPTIQEMAGFLMSLQECNTLKIKDRSECYKKRGETQTQLLAIIQSRCAAFGMAAQQIPALMFQELFMGTGNKESCKETRSYNTSKEKDGTGACPSINSLLSAAQVEQYTLQSQLNVLIGLSMYNLTMANIQSEQIIQHTTCQSFKDIFNPNK